MLRNKPRPLTSRKLLVAAIGVATINYAAACDDNSTSGNLPAPQYPTSGNLPSPEPGTSSSSGGTSGTGAAQDSGADASDAAADAADANDGAPQ